MAGDNTLLESQGRAVDAALLFTVDAQQVAYIDGWLGIMSRSGDSGDTVAMLTDHREYQFTVPAALTVAKGDTVYIDSADLTGHIPDDTGYGIASGAGLIALFKATSAKDGNNVVTGIMLPEGL